MRERRVGSVVAVEGTRPVGILTERDLVRFTAAGDDRHRAGPRVDDRAPDTIGPGRRRRAPFVALRARLPAHPGGRGGRLVGIVSMRDLMRIAEIQPAERRRHTIRRGLEGVVVADTTIGDVRGLEGFYHYRQYNAVELARSRARSRTCGT